jgi:hypothetical protein
LKTRITAGKAVFVISRPQSVRFSFIAATAQQLSSGLFFLPITESSELNLHVLSFGARKLLLPISDTTEKKRVLSHARELIARRRSVGAWMLTFSEGYPRALRPKGELGARVFIIKNRAVNPEPGTWLLALKETPYALSEKNYWAKRLKALLYVGEIILPHLFYQSAAGYQLLIKSYFTKVSPQLKTYCKILYDLVPSAGSIFKC